MMGLSFGAAIIVIESNQRLNRPEVGRVEKKYELLLLQRMKNNKSHANDRSLKVLFVVRQQCTGVSEVS
jgi:hypothetical protein